MDIGQIQSSVVIVCGVAAMLATFLSIFILMRIFFMSKKQETHDIKWLKKSLSAVLVLFAGILLLFSGVGVIVLIIMGGLYEMVREYAPDRCCQKLKVLGLTVVLCLLVTIGCFVFKNKVGTAVAFILGNLFLVGGLVGFIAYVVAANRYYKQYHRIDGLTKSVEQSDGDSDYVHPCQGQCEDPKIVLEKSMKLKYKYNTRTLHGSATRKGRYYRGKQRKS